MKIKINKIRWKSGVGEALGFAACSLLLLLLVISLLSISNYEIRSQQITTACYSAGRAAVVSSDPDLAKQRAEAVLKTIFGKSNVHTSETDEIDHVWYSIEVDDDEWRIGNIMTITVSQHINEVFPIPETDIEFSLAMMIEDETVQK